MGNPDFLRRALGYARQVQPLRAWYEWALLAALLALVAPIASRQQWFSPLDGGWYDALVSSRPLPVPKDIVLINIEPNTLDRNDLNRRLWQLGDSAELLDRLNQSAPAAIMLNLDLTSSNPLERAGEARLGQAIKDSGKVVLPVIAQSQQDRIVSFRLPIAPLVNPAAALAHNQSGQERAVRYLPLELGNGEFTWPHAALSLAAIATGSPLVQSVPKPLTDETGLHWQERRLLYLRYIDPDHGFTTLSARQVLNGEVAEEDLQGKIILIGTRHSEQKLATPVNWLNDRQLDAQEILANGINTLRHDAGVTVLSPAANAALTVTCVLAVLVTYLFAPTHRLFPISLTAIAGELLLAWLLFRFGNLWFACTSAVAMTAIAYPLWAWRRLEATQRFLLEEQRGLVIYLRKGAATKATGAHHSIDQQIQFIQNARDRLRVAEQQQKSLLHFVSHDMRSPLASILAVIQMRDEHPDESGDADRFIAIRRYTAQAMRLAEEFLQLSYAENAKPENFRTVDLLLSMENAIDLARPLANERGIRINTELPEIAFVCGSQGLLERALTNLLHNAIKFSPAGGDIEIHMVMSGAQWQCIFGNACAPPVAPLDNSVSTGEPTRRPDLHVSLGLALVRLVAHKHAGAFHLQQPSDHCQAVATLSLPVEPSAA